MSKQKNKSMEKVMNNSEGLKHSIKTKDVIMIGVGGTIGTGLFLSSGWVVKAAGPGEALIAYTKND